MWRQAAFEGVGSMPMARIRTFRAEQQEAVDADMLRRGARRGGSGDPGASPAGPAASPATANGGHPAAGATQESGSGATPASSADGQSSKGDHVSAVSRITVSLKPDGVCASAGLLLSVCMLLQGFGG